MVLFLIFFIHTTQPFMEINNKNLQILRYSLSLNVLFLRSNRKSKFHYAMRSFFPE